MYNVILTDEEIDNIVKCIDSTLFDEFDLLDVYLEYLKNGDDVEELEALKKVIIPDILKQINEHIVLITHVDRKFDPSNDDSSYLYDINKYLLKVNEKTKQFISLIENDSSAKSDLS